MKKYVTKKIMYPKTRLIRGAGMSNDDLDINNSIFLHMTDGIIAFDIGDKRIGIAISDPFNEMALPVETYWRKGFEKDIDYPIGKYKYIFNAVSHSRQRYCCHV